MSVGRKRGTRKDSIYTFRRKVRLYRGTVLCLGIGTTYQHIEHGGGVYRQDVCEYGRCVWRKADFLTFDGQGPCFFWSSRVVCVFCVALECPLLLET